MSASTSEGAIRLGGLASGFDTEAIVESLLAVEKNRIEKLEEEKSPDMGRYRPTTKNFIRYGNETKSRWNRNQPFI